MNCGVLPYPTVGDAEKSPSSDFRKGFRGKHRPIQSAWRFATFTDREQSPESRSYKDVKARETSVRLSQRAGRDMLHKRKPTLEGAEIELQLTCWGADFGLVPVINALYGNCFTPHKGPLR